MGAVVTERDDQASRPTARRALRYSAQRSQRSRVGCSRQILKVGATRSASQAVQNKKTRPSGPMTLPLDSSVPSGQKRPSPVTEK